MQPVSEPTPLRVEIACIVDRSGSMDALRADAIGGFNAFLRDQQTLPGEARFSLVLFDHEYKRLYDRVPLADARPLDETTYVPRGQTALLDAIGRTLAGLAERIGAEPAAAHPDKVIVTILTDGLENASRDWTAPRVASLIGARRAAGWEFVFLAANQDAFAAAERVGIAREDAAGFAATGAGVRQSFDVISEQITMRRTGRGPARP